MSNEYIKLIEKGNNLKSELDKIQEQLNELENIIYQDKMFIIDLLIEHLKATTNNDYFWYKSIDIDSNVTDILVKENSELFEKHFKENTTLDFNIERLLDKTLFNNKDDIILLDMNFADNLLDIGYLADSLEYESLSYSENLKNTLSDFIDYIISNNIYCKN